jgi:hypothetical protein
MGNWLKTVQRSLRQALIYKDISSVPTRIIRITKLNQRGHIMICKPNMVDPRFIITEKQAWSQKLLTKVNEK